MLKVDKVEFWHGADIYTINSNQIQDFPLIGGTKANIITTQIWNQHGDTFIDSFMDADDGTFTFILPLIGKNRYDTVAMRKSLTDICNPLNGTITMKVYLNTGDVFNRDIVFSTAPAFPIGSANRNPFWQLVQLNFTAHNPFWYADEEIVETFQSVEPEFIFPFTMSTSAPEYFGNILPNNIATNEGQVPAPVAITIVGACVNPRIDNITTGEYIKFNNLTMGASDELEINTAFGEKKVTLNGTNIFNKLDFSSSFFQLVKGDNEIKFSDDTGNNTAAIHFVYQNLFITI
jgi:Phage tail protein